MRSQAVVVIALLLSLAPPVRADSDGYYCVGSGYLAVEFRPFQRANSPASHVLKIARFDSAAGPRWTGEVVVDDFQTHTLACGVATILIEGAGNHNELISYLIDLDSIGVPRVATRRANSEWFSRPRVIPPGPSNIGDWARPGVIELPSRGGTRRFQLRVTDSTHRASGNIVHEMRSRLEEIDGRGTVLRSLLISAGSRLETIDDAQQAAPLAPTPNHVLVLTKADLSEANGARSLDSAHMVCERAPFAFHLSLRSTTRFR